MRWPIDGYYGVNVKVGDLNRILEKGGRKFRGKRREIEENLREKRDCISYINFNDALKYDLLSIYNYHCLAVITNNYYSYIFPLLL